VQDKNITSLCVAAVLLAETACCSLADWWLMYRALCRYNQVLLMIETCQAATMLNRMQAPRVIGLASSIKGECKA
jgi:glycosylphosphatidylinositol transamidase (GPIT) subunit GPI8